MTAVDTVILELQETRTSGTFEPVRVINADLQAALAFLQNSSLTIPIANNTILSNISGAPAAPAANGLSAIIDASIDNTQGDILYRSATGWTDLPPGTAGSLLQTGGAGANPAWSTLGQIKGTQTNDSANAGNIGEYISSTVTLGSPVALSNSVVANVTSISLTPGDWDISTALYLVTQATTNIAQIYSSIGTVSATLNLNVGTYSANAEPPSFTENSIQPSFFIPRLRVSLSVTTTYYFVTEVIFTVNTCSAAGVISARRVR